MCPCVTSGRISLRCSKLVHNFFRVAAAYPDDVFYGIFSGPRHDGANSGCVSKRNKWLPADGGFFAAIEF